VVRVREPEAARAALAGAGYSVTLADDGALALGDATALDRPDDVAVRLVQAGHPPTLLAVEQEDLEGYFLRLIGLEQDAEARP
jgi:ABC-2 type transport system ATP-binding protein